MRRSSSDQQEIRELAKRFHYSLRQFSRARKADRKSLQECDQMKARKECATRFWKFAAHTLDDTQEDIQPAFDVDSAEEYFMSAYSSEPRVYYRPLWLPTAPSPDVAFVLEDISAGEIQQAIMRTISSTHPRVPMTRYHMWSLSSAHRWPVHLLTCSACVGSKDECPVGGSMELYGLSLKLLPRRTRIRHLISGRLPSHHVWGSSSPPS